MAGLYLYNPDFKERDEQIIAKGMFGIDKDSVMPIKDWQAMAAEVKKHNKIDDLVFSFHGEGGGMTVGNNNYNLDEKFVINLFQNAPKVERISFVSCVVGLGPAKMWRFAQLFNASSISGYTWWLLPQHFDISFPRGVDEGTIKKTLDAFDPYTVEALPAATVLKVHPRPIRIVALYGSSDQTEASKVPIPLSESKGHKPWKARASRTIKAADAANAERVYAGNPVPEFEYVTVVSK